MFREPFPLDATSLGPEALPSGDSAVSSSASFDPPPPPSELQQTVEQLRRVFSALERDLVGFGPLLIQALYALVTRENLLIFSPPGTAKTLFAQVLFSRIQGARVFDTQMSKGTLAEELFGSIDIESMKKGRMVHNTTGTLIDADLAFIDEFFDANDMVLRALLGVFNERIFKKGSQCEKARLHTGIAAANYLRATEVTEAVLDRFLFRAYVMPDYDPFTLTAIDQAFARHYGRTELPPETEQVALAELSHLADIARGLVPDRVVRIPPHVLVLKNLLLNRYRELLKQAVEPGRSGPLYLSPRTYAKTRLVLNAAALLRGRMHVIPADLAELRYVVTTIGGQPEQAQCFDKAFHEVLLKVREPDWKHIDHLVGVVELAEHLMAQWRDGRPVPANGFLQKILRFFGLLSEGDITFEHLRRYVEQIKPQESEIQTLKLRVLQRIQELKRRMDHPDRELLR